MLILKKYGYFIQLHKLPGPYLVKSQETLRPFVKGFQIKLEIPGYNFTQSLCAWKVVNFVSIPKTDKRNFNR